MCEKMKAPLFAEQNGFGLRRSEYASRLHAHSIFSRHFYIVRGPKTSPLTTRFPCQRPTSA